MTVVYLDRKLIAISTCVVAVVFAIGVVIGNLSNSGGVSEASGASSTLDSPARPLRTGRLVNDGFHAEQETIQRVLDEVDTTRLRSYLKFLTDRPHIAAQERDVELTNWIRDEWNKEGLDRVDLATYTFYLSWPNQTNPNKVQLLDAEGNVKFTSRFKEKEVREGDDSPDFVHAFNGYAPAGVVNAPLVYAHYARVEDLRRLEGELGVNITGKICMARYGKIFRGNKVRNCQDRGAIGIVLFSDPADVAVYGTDADDVYPNTIFLPGSGVQRGSTYIGEGDPLSPGWPSVDNAYRIQAKDVDGLPKIPSQPIGYDDATHLLMKMGGNEVPPDWKGKVPGVTYRLGEDMSDGYTVRLEVNNFAGDRKSSNVIGYIKGSVEPDRYVILSNHRDAWGYGSADPSSGTAQLMEVVRSLGKLKRGGWRPRRTLVFCSFASEEYGLEGSYEWVYDKINKISGRAVALINTDTCTSGPIAYPQASPILQDVVLEALKHASDPTAENGDKPTERDYFPSEKPSHGRSYYDFWLEWWNKDKSEEDKGHPEIKLLGSGTDHAGFAFYAGVPAANLRWKPDKKKYKGIGTYPTYHTGYETFYLMDKLIDPGYKIHRTCAQTSLHMLFNLADSTVLPYNINLMARVMKASLDTLRKDNVTQLLEDNGASLEYVESAVKDFIFAAIRVMVRVKAVDHSNPVQVRILNDQLMQLERVFIIPGGLPDRPESRHAIFAPAKFNKYGASAFPGLLDLLHEVDELNEDEKKERWERIKRHVSDLMIMIKSASDFLQPVDKI